MTLTCHGHHTTLLGCLAGHQGVTHVSRVVAVTAVTHVTESEQSNPHAGSGNKHSLLNINTCINID